MTYDEIQAAARGNMGKCKSCPVCNGLGCKNTIPGPGSKGSGTVFNRNYNAWQDVMINMDTIAENRGVDTGFALWGEQFDLPVFAAPVGAVETHYSSLYNEHSYTGTLARGCRKAGIAAFTGDGLNEIYFTAGCDAMVESGFAIPTVKPWHKDLVFRKMDYAKERGAKIMAMDVDASGLPFLKKMDPPPAPRVWPSWPNSLTTQACPSSSRVS